MTALIAPPVPSQSSNRAVEVVATFGDSVVGVRHLTDPRGGVMTTATKALLAGGAALLATAAITFGYAANVASDNADALARHKAMGKPSWSFRPQMLHRGLDVLMLGGSFLGLGALGLGLARRRSERNPQRVRVGDGSDVDFAIDGVGASFDLIAPMGDGFAVRVAPGAAPMAITADTRMKFQVGNTRFLVASVPAPSQTATAGLTFDRRPLAFFAASAVVHLGIVALMSNVVGDADAATSNSNVSEYALHSGESTSTPDDPPEKLLPGSSTNGNGTVAEQASAMPLASGQIGSDKPVAGDPRKRQIKGQDPRWTRSQALDRAIRDGVLGSEYLTSGSAFTALNGDADLTEGMDLLDLEGGFDGDGDGVPDGFGNGRRGKGPGGGGSEWNSKYVGDYDTLPNPGKDGNNWSLKERPGDGDGGRERRVPKSVVPKLPKCVGVECDPTIVARYIKRNMSKITYCYERQLLASPGISGTVEALFTVSPTGVVIQSSAKGVHPEVSSCIADVIDDIQFPKFDETFQVRYPFHMRPTGA